MRSNRLFVLAVYVEDYYAGPRETHELLHSGCREATLALARTAEDGNVPWQEC